VEAPVVVATNPAKGPVEVILEPDTIKTASGGRLDIYVRASEDDMRQGRFKIEFREEVHAGDTRNFSFYRGDGTIDSIIEPFIDSSVGSSEIDSSAATLTYAFQVNADALYGYILSPNSSITGSGFCNEDIGIFATDSCFPSNLLGFGFAEIFLTFAIPEGMPVYAPWMEVSDRVFKLVSDGTSTSPYYNSTTLTVAAWGNFSSVESLGYDGHTCWMLGYDNDTTNAFALTKFTYDYFYRALQGNISFIPPVNVIIYVPENSYNWPVKEGFGGFYIPNITADNWLPVFDYQGYKTQCNGYFNRIENGNQLTIGPVHCVAHATLYYFLSPGWWWDVEGLAVYYQFDMLQRIGLIDSTDMNREIIEHLRYYQEHIIGTVNDHAPYGFPGPDFNRWEDDWCIAHQIGYVKGAMAYYALNEIILKSTNNQKELIDLFAALYRGFKDSYETSYDNFISKLNQLTGRDFQEFFDKFIYGTDPLPLEISGDDILLTYMPPVPGTLKPSISVCSPTSVASDSAVLNGIINPKGIDTTYYFQYGTSTSYGSTTSSTTLGAGTIATSVNTLISGLTPNSTYYYRLVATNDGGISYSAGKSFSTTILYVEPSGSCGGKTPCYATIQEAVDAGSSGAIIKIVQGTYNESLGLTSSKTVTIQGGWDSTFSTQSSTTIINSMTLNDDSGTTEIDNLVLQ